MTTKTYNPTEQYAGLGTSGWLKVADRSYWIDSRSTGIPEVWVHTRPGRGDAALYLKGVSLVDGANEQDDIEYLKRVIADRLAS